jgi:hypothetical protein
MIPMTIDEIKAAVDAGKSVCWATPGYRVRKDALGQYHIVFCANESAIGLTNRAGTRLNGRKEYFFILEGAA